ncbi:MAG: nucleoside-diphosphate kinase [Candidatus Hydrothermarchaeales archaeon]
MERTFVMVKPDGVSRGLIGEVISRIEEKGFRIAVMKIMQIDEELARKHYQEHEGKPFFDDLVSFITSGPVVSMIVEGDGAIETVRTMVGATDPKDAAPGSIRGDLALDVSMNVVHASDSHESAKREIALFFSSEDVH